MFLTDVDLSCPLTDHSFWKDVRGVWLPLPELKAGSTCAKLYDLSPYRNHAIQTTASYQPTWKATTKGLGLDFDGSNNDVRATSQTADIIGNKASICCAIAGPAVANRGVVSKRVSDYHTIAIRTSLTTGKGTFLVRNSIGSQVTVDSTDTVVDGSLHTCCGTYDGSYVRIFVDGAASGSASQSGNIYRNNDPLCIGSYQGAYYFDGVIYCSTIHARAITASEAAFFHLQFLKGYPDLIRRIPAQRHFYMGTVADQLLSDESVKQLVTICS